MKPEIFKIKNQIILYDAVRLEHPAPELFEHHWLAENGCIEGSATGRGQALLSSWTKSATVCCATIIVAGCSARC